MDYAVNKILQLKVKKGKENEAAETQSNKVNTQSNV